MKRVIILACALIIMSLGLFACNRGEDSTLAKSLPFTVSGSYFELTGNNAIYAPNATYDFNLTIRNDTEEEWKGNCYIFLIDKNGPLLDIADIDINLLNNGDQENTVIRLVLPANIKPGAYGLALLFPDKGQFIQTIYVGENIPSEPAGPWPDISSFKQSPTTPILEELTVDDFSKQHHCSLVASIEEGENISVTLGSNPSAGFKWPDIAQIHNQDVIKQLDHKYVEPEQAGFVGASGKEVWTFKALKKGTTTISMEYRRPWENAEEAEWTFIAIITIE